MISLILSVMTLAIVAFSLYVICANLKQHKQPLVLVLFCLGLLATGPLIFQLAPTLKSLYIALLPLMFFALTPSLWAYHCAITSSEPWVWHTGTVKHYWPLLAVSILSILLLLLPKQEFNKVFFSDLDIEGTQTLVVVYAFFSAILIWCAISTYYLVKILKRTFRYREELKNVFADHSDKFFWWVEWLVGLLMFTWLYALLVMVVDDRYEGMWLSDNGVFTLLLLLVWLIASRGIRLDPGFSDVYRDITSSESDSDSDNESGKGKYLRSALGETQSKRIACKLEHALYQEKLYLDASLTLFKLAKHLGVSNQYLSQTLNQALQTTFFDYVNQARIEAAKPMLLQNKDTVLNIAMAVGYNARSSFYKAFKQYTGLTPSEFKKLNAES